MANKQITVIIGNSNFTPEEIIEECSKIIEDVLVRKDQSSTLAECIECIIVDTVGVSISRKIISNSICIVKKFPEEESLQLSLVLLDSLKLNLMSFEEQYTNLCYHTSKIYEARKDFIKAAKQLSNIPIDNGQKQYSKHDRLDMYLEIAHLFLEGQQGSQAEVYVNRASGFNLTSMDYKLQIKTLQLKYKICYARILDYRTKFLDAAKRYAQLSLETQVLPEARSKLIRNAVICAIIAPAGVQRRRLLATLHKDERSSCLPFYQMLSNTQSGHLITKEQIELFDKELSQHQRAKTANGMTILDAAFMEHNVLALSNIYKSIKLSTFSEHLGVTKQQAEKVVGKMINEGTVKGTIDQVEELVHFERSVTPWDEHVNIICNKVNTVMDLLLNHEPEFTKTKQKQYGC